MPEKTNFVTHAWKTVLLYLCNKIMAIHFIFVFDMMLLFFTLANCKFLKHYSFPYFVIFSSILNMSFYLLWNVYIVLDNTVLLLCLSLLQKDLDTFHKLFFSFSGFFFFRIFSWWIFRHFYGKKIMLKND